MLFWCPESVELVSVVDWDSTSLAWVFPAVVDSSAVTVGSSSIGVAVLSEGGCDAGSLDSIADGLSVSIISSSFTPAGVPSATDVAATVVPVMVNPDSGDSSIANVSAEAIFIDAAVLVAVAPVISSMGSSIIGSSVAIDLDV